MFRKLEVKPTLIGLGAVALGLLTVPPAFSASTKECLGGKPNVVGTKGSDVIVVTADEAGTRATVNGKKVKVPSGPTIIFGDKGNDRISFTQDGGGPARVCGGAGNDTITGTDITRIHGGDGKDTVEVHDQCGFGHPGIEVFAVETVRTSAAIGDDYDEGPCN
ncbi:MAG TPA: hypothetical protein VHL53_09930 [Acidimicrobiia bacterium]|nr:hypothetical protein [Acidimicrobiia bacterium]